MDFGNSSVGCAPFEGEGGGRCVVFARACRVNALPSADPKRVPLAFSSLST